MKDTQLSVAIIGIRGIHVSYSGFETLATELARHLAQQSIRVIVYNRSTWKQDAHDVHQNVIEYSIPTLQSKYSESFIHTLLATLHVLFTQKVDAIIYLGVGNTPFTIFPRLWGVKTLLNIDGLDWRRKKWNILGRLYLKSCERLSQWLPSQTITDTYYVQSYFRSEYGPSLHVIPNGFSKQTNKTQLTDALKNIVPGSYYLWCGRIVPDNNLEEAILAFKKLPTTKKCIIVGDDVYDPGYVTLIQSMIKNDERFINTGFIPYDGYLMLLENAYAYIETKRSGGSHPSLIQALGQGCLVVANNHPSIKELTFHSAMYYKRGDIGSLADTLNRTELFSNAQYQKTKKKINKASKHLTWIEVSRQYVLLLEKLCKK